ncbi:MAG: nicotinic acid mononucleotide adenyltransferase [Aquaticitalea sp.]
MKTLKLLFGFAFVATLFTSCYTEVIHDDYIDTTPNIPLNQLLGSYDLWYVDINQTVGYGETPFLQIAFTMSFRNGTVYANNNLVGFSPNGQGNGLGIRVGYYDTYDMILDISHDIDGYNSFDVYQIDTNTIELYNPFNDTSYFLHGYQRSNFDYDFVFYDNIHYFLQEYEAWEKTYTSQTGALNEFDNENYLQFLSGGNDSTFRSSQDANISNPNNIYWDYTGVYGVGNICNNSHLKTLTLDYDFFDNEFFEMSVISDQRISLYHPSSRTTYEFTGTGYIQYMRESNAKGDITKTTTASKKRKQKTVKSDNPRINERS